jgi:glyoxylase-like metal-dependent hydrolase (beta-lactamase superfamily II)
MVPYELGLHEIGDGVFAYLQPDGSWGYSNAGLVAGNGASLLVDTLFDLRLTEAMLAAMAPVTSSCPISTVVNTHANGDHCHGNQLVPGARVVASAATAREMADLPASSLHALKQLDLGPDGNAFVEEAFGRFRFDDIGPATPTETFSGRLEAEAGGRHFVVEEVGPAHTAGDVIVHLPDAGVVFAGDILFIGSTPIVWAGPIANWLAAMQRIRELEPAVVVPGHGPVVSVAEIAQVEAYLHFVHFEAAQRADSGMSALEAAFDIDLGDYGAWSDSERIVANVDAVYSEVRPGHSRMNVIALFGEMGRYRASRRPASS